MADNVALQSAIADLITTEFGRMAEERFLDTTGSPPHHTIMETEKDYRLTRQELLALKTVEPGYATLTRQGDIRGRLEGRGFIVPAGLARYSLTDEGREALVRDHEKSHR